MGDATETTGLMAVQAGKIGGHISTGKAVLWRRPDPTPRLLAVAGPGIGPGELGPRLAAERRAYRKANALDLAALSVNAGGAAVVAVLAVERWPLEHPVVNLSVLALTLLASAFLLVRAKRRMDLAHDGFGGGPLHPFEGALEDIVVTRSGIAAAGARGKVRTIAFEHVHSLVVTEMGGGDHGVAFMVRNKEGTSPFAVASRVDEASARALVAALRGRVFHFVDDAARFDAELTARTVVLPPDVFAAARSAVEAGRYPDVGSLATEAVARALAA